MTNKEKWKLAISEYIMTSNVMSGIREKAIYPYIKLSSVETDRGNRMRYRCPHCFTTQTYRTKGLEGCNDKFNCKHCGAELYRKISVVKDGVGMLRFSGGYLTESELVYFTAADILDTRGILYVHVHDGTVENDVGRKINKTYCEVRGFGFIYPDGRFYYRFGDYTTCSVGTLQVNWTKFYYTDDALELLSGWRRDKITVDYGNALYQIKHIEDVLRYSSSPANSYGAKKAKQIMEADPVCDVSELPQAKPNGIITNFVSYDEIKGISDYNGFCTECGIKFRFQLHGRLIQNFGECPKCKKRKKLYHDGSYYSNESLYIDMTDRGDLVVRLCRDDLTVGKNTFDPRRRETERVYIRTASENILWDRLYECDGSLRYKKTNELPHNDINKSNIFFSDAAAEFLKYSGAKEYADKLGKENVSVSAFVEYIAVWLKHPFVERILKLGWDDLLRDIVNEALLGREIDFNEDGKGINDVLMLNKPLAKYYADLYHEQTKFRLNELRKFLEIDPNVDPKDIAWCYAEKLHVSNIVEIIGILGISVHQVCEYLERVRISQCFAPYPASTEWRDYLKACQTIDADLSDKTVRYPSSLKREHDRAVAKQKIILDAKKDKEFQNICSEYEEKYKYEDDDYMIIAPSSMQDLFEEGRKLNHCVGSYADRIIAGRSCICFIRRKKDPTAPFFTMEIYSEQERVSQIHGLSNCNVDHYRDGGLAAFLKTWAKKKKLSLPAA